MSGLSFRALLICVTLAIALIPLGLFIKAELAHSSDWEVQSSGTITVSSVTAKIDSYYPSTKITVYKGDSFTLKVWFTNTGSTGAYFYAGYSIWDSGGVLKFSDWSEKIYLNSGQQGSASWTITINTAGEYWLQFGIWDEARSKLLAKAPSPSENLIKVIEKITPPTVGTFSITVPQSGSGTAKISVYNPNTVSITVTKFEIISSGGFTGTITIAGVTKDVVNGAYWTLNLNINPGTTEYVELIITDKGSSAGTYTIVFKLSGTP